MMRTIHESLVVSVEPTIEPVTVEELQLQARVTDDSETTYLEGLITSARTWAETFTGRQFINATYIKRYDASYFPRGFTLERPPLVSVTSVAYVDTNGDSQTASTDLYTVDTASTIGRIELAYNQDWPAVRDVIQSITITYVAGYGTTAASVPRQIRQAILIMAATMHENREATITGDTISKVPLNLESLLWDYRMMPFN